MERPHRLPVTEPSPPRIEVLLVEDNEADILLTREGFKSASVPNLLHVVRDGDEALEFLQQKGRHVLAPRPDLILLDWNLPRRSGKDVLQFVKSDSSLKSIPIIILTTSNSEHDINESYGMHANSFITKPIDFYEFTAVIRSLEDYWMTLVQLPSEFHAA